VALVPFFHDFLRHILVQEEWHSVSLADLEAVSKEVEWPGVE
jgi:hypothetical protein